jgi:hypothetical protein
VKIEIGAVTLCAGGAESPEDLTREAADTVQIVPGLRATAVQVFNRGNRAHTLRFQITRTYADVKAAETALLDHPDAVPTSGNVKLTTEGASPVVRYIRAATVHAFAARQVGVSIRWVYTITGGAVSTSA